MTKARIFKPAKTAMQSGRGNTRQWVLEFDRQTPKTPDALMGWNGSTETLPQVRLRFPTREEAMDYATRKGFSFQVEEPQERTLKLQTYADNFR